MKRRNLISADTISVIFLVLFSVLGSLAQDYNPFRKEFTYQFLQASDDTIASLRIDSSYISGEDSVFIFNPIRLKFNNSIDSNNIFGKKMIQGRNGDYLFLTADQDTFLIKTRVSINTSWTFNSKSKVSAVFKEIKSFSFLGLNDSVMVIALSNSTRIEISKKYGFINVVNFIKNNLGTSANQQLILNAIPELNAGIFLSHPFAYYDFQPGDVFGYYGHYNPLGPPAFSRKFLRILDRQNFARDSIVYKIRRDDSYGNHDTLYLTIPSALNYYNHAITDYFDSSIPPYNSQRWDTTGFMNYKALYSLSNQSSPIISGPSPEFGHSIVKSKFNSRFSISLNIFLEEEGQTIQYVQGLGEVSHDINSGVGAYSAGQVLMCYIKGNEKFGNCDSLQVLLAIGKEIFVDQFNIFPNPSNSTITVSSGDINISTRSSISIYNSLGEIVYYRNSISDLTNTPIDISTWASGIYYLSITGIQDHRKSFIKN